MKGIPKIIYKYRSWDESYHRDLIFNQELFLSSSSKFNDPFDTGLPFKYKKEDLTPENIFLKLIEVARRKYPTKTEEEIHTIAYERQSTTDFLDDSYWLDDSRKWKKDIEEKYGICSFTKNKNNLLMWSHYASSHNGFVVGFDSEIISNHISGCIGPVNYSSKFPEIEIQENIEFEILKLLYTKSTAWEYEEEIRITKFGSSNKIINIPKESIKEIILGCNLKPQAKEEVINFVKSNLNNACLFEATLDQSEFKLNIIKLFF